MSSKKCRAKNPDKTKTQEKSSAPLQLNNKSSGTFLVYRAQIRERRDPTRLKSSKSDSDKLPLSDTELLSVMR